MRGSARRRILRREAAPYRSTAIWSNMNRSHTMSTRWLPAAALCAVAGCASGANRGSAGTSAQPADATATAPSEAPSVGGQRRIQPFVLTAAEIAEAPGVMNAHDAVRTLRPSFLRTRGSTAPIAGGLVGRRAPQGQGSQPGSSGGSTPSAAPSVPEDPGIIVYVDRQRYGRVESLRDIAISTVEEIRFLNVGDANSLFGMGHPHGVIQVITKRGGPTPQ